MEECFKLWEFLSTDELFLLHFDAVLLIADRNVVFKQRNAPII